MTQNLEGEDAYSSAYYTIMVPQAVATRKCKEVTKFLTYKNVSNSTVIKRTANEEISTTDFLHQFKQKDDYYNTANKILIQNRVIPLVLQISMYFWNPLKKCSDRENEYSYVLLPVAKMAKHVGNN